MCFPGWPHTSYMYTNYRLLHLHSAGFTIFSSSLSNCTWLCNIGKYRRSVFWFMALLLSCRYDVIWIQWALLYLTDGTPVTSGDTYCLTWIEFEYEPKYLLETILLVMRFYVASCQLVTLMQAGLVTFRLRIYVHPEHQSTVLTRTFELYLRGLERLLPRYQYYWLRYSQFQLPCRRRNCLVPAMPSRSKAGWLYFCERKHLFCCTEICNRPGWWIVSCSSQWWIM